MIYSHVFKSFPVCYGSAEITNSTVILAAEITQAHAWAHHVLSVRSSATHSITTQAAGASTQHAYGSRTRDRGRPDAGSYSFCLEVGTCPCCSLASAPALPSARDDFLPACA